MKMPAIFKRDYAGEREKASADLAAARRQLVELQEQRTAALGEAAAPVIELRKIDKATEEARATVALLEDRCRRLSVLSRQAELARLERERTAAIDNIIAPKLAQMQKRAGDLEQAVIQLGAAFAVLDHEADELRSTWPAAVPKPPYWTGAFSMSDIRSRIEYAMRRGSVERLAEFVDIDRPESISASVHRQIESSLQELRAVPIALHEPDGDVDQVDVAPVEPVRGLAALATT